jgi:NitT/TauT family transport system permease protein
VLQTIPILALVPLIGFWFSFGVSSRILVCVLISIFPIVSTTLFGLRGVDRGDHDLFTLYGATRGARLRKLQWPAALPAIFAGLRISAGLSVIGAIVGDFSSRRASSASARCWRSTGRTCAPSSCSAR